MRALDFIASIRRMGRKPSFVMLDLVGGKSLAPWMTESGAVHAEIGGHEALSDIDFRPLVGLRVHLGERSGNEVRLRRAAKLAADVKPSMLAVYIENNEKFVMHRLFADGTSDRSAL